MKTDDDLGVRIRNLVILFYMSVINLIVRALSCALLSRRPVLLVGVVLGGERGGTLWAE